MNVLKFALVMIITCSWVCAVAGTGLTQEDYRTSQFTLYDNYFKSCQCSFVKGVDSTGVEAVVLNLTFDEPDINIDNCNQITFVLRNADKVVMPRVDKVRRGDVRYRRFKDVELRTVSLYFAISWSQLEQMLETEAKVVILQIAGIDYRRNVNNAKHNIEKLHKELLNANITNINLGLQ